MSLSFRCHFPLNARVSFVTQVKMSALVKFCPNCSNLLTPAESKMRLNTLVYKCRSCPHEEAVAESDTVVYRRDVHYREKEKLMINKDVIHDPTLSRTQDYVCAKCDGTEAVYWQLPESQMDDAMGLVYVCVNCGTWRVQGRSD